MKMVLLAKLSITGKMMAACYKGAAKGAQSKRVFRDVASTPGSRSESPLKRTT